MKNELPVLDGGVAVNRALPSTGASKVISMLSDENASEASVGAPSTPITFFKFLLRVSSATVPPPTLTSFTLTMNSNLLMSVAGLNDSIFKSSVVSYLPMSASAPSANDSQADSLALTVAAPLYFAHSRNTA